MSNQFEGLFASQGWMCPICKRVYSPYTSMCFYCGGGQKTILTTTLEGVPSAKPYTINQSSECKENGK